MRGTWFGVLLLLAAPARSAERSWSVISGSAVGQSRLALQLQAGWPALSLSGFYGASDKLDVGLRVAFSYGQDGSLGFGPSPVPGFRLQGGVRYTLADAGTVRLGVTFVPGLAIDYLPGLVTPRILAPVQIVLAIAPIDTLAVHVGVDVPLYVTPGTFGGLTLPILVGAGAEYHVDRSLAVTGLLRTGPALELTRPGAPARFAIEVLAGVAYRI
ncbi:MAG TPA: hypothetical protein VIG99_11570 [Myxococcaceae bacterium]|jgi:hypothetical protein